MNQPEASPSNNADAGRGLSEGLGPALTEAAYECLGTLAGVDTYDVNLKDHAAAWRAIEGFAAQVMAAERERLTAALRSADAAPAMSDKRTAFLWAADFLDRA